ncbi:hypothetical protein L6164_024567 [Bauhinia variegata]|uniref:Uncharacterized protein n=1 Tax=Bauhinia variegata TaxID=167791 RepID=A0ACB9LZ50_BAUVA|nr:hypothetical protein L6164_024567 [Bauhinia variegata]
MSTLEKPFFETEVRFLSSPTSWGSVDSITSPGSSSRSSSSSISRLSPPLWLHAQINRSPQQIATHGEEFFR